MTDSPPVSVPPSRGRLLLALGLLLPVAGIAGYVIQVAAHVLTAPWYLPLTATAGVLLVVGSVRKRRTLWRWLALVLVLLFAVAEWSFLLRSRLPAYTGPLAVGRPFPAFATLRANGTAFTQQDLPGNSDNVMVFFRGRW